MSGNALVTVSNLSMQYKGVYKTLPWKRRPIPVLDGIDLDIGEREVVGLAGESGCGKTTLCTILAGLTAPTGGSVQYRGREVSSLGRRHRRLWKKDVQMVFQDPFNALNPAFTVRRNLVEPLRIHRMSTRTSEEGAARKALEEVGLPQAATYLDRYPHQLSGGQCQRVCLARSLIVRPRFLIADEPVSMLDLPIRAAFLDLLGSMKTRRGLSVLLVSHNLAELRYLADRICIMHRGRIVESGPPGQLIETPRHPKTVELIDAIPPDTFR